MINVIKNTGKYLRVSEWISSKVTMMLGILAYFICLNATPITTALQELVIYFLFLFTLSAVCYVLNDFFDLEIDKKAGKKKVIATMPKWLIWLTVILFAIVGNAPLFIFAKNKVLCAILVALTYLFGVCYSIPGLRFKERGVLGLVECSLAQHCVPLSILFVFESLTGWKLALWCGWFVLSFMNGLRYILIHQYIDRDNDKATNVHTFVADRKVGVKKAIIILCCLEAAFSAGVLVPLAIQNPIVISVGVLFDVGLEFCIYQVLNVFAKKDWMVSFDSVPLESLLNMIMPLMFGICMTRISLWALAFCAFVFICCLKALVIKIKIALVYIKSKLTTKRIKGKRNMETVVYCLKQNENQITQAVKKIFKTKKVTFADYENLTQKGGRLVIDHELVSTLKRDEIKAYESVCIYFKGELCDISLVQALLEKRKRCLDSGDWQMAKDVNEVLCDIDFLCKNTVNNSYPDFFQIESNNFCNSKCIMCVHYFRQNESRDALSMETLDCMKDVVRLSRIINLNGMGEPFISKHINEQIDYYVGYGNKIVANTNLSVLNDGLIERIRKNFECLAISVDGARKETYEAIRIGLNFDTLIKNLYLLKEKAPDLKKIISVVVMRQNVCEMPEIVELAHKVAIDRVDFFALTPNLIIGNGGDVMTNYPKVLEYYSVKALEAGEKYGIRVTVANEDKLNRDITYDEIKEELAAMDSLPKWKTREEEEAMKEVGAKANAFLEQNDVRQNDTVASTVKCHGVCDWLLKNCYTNLNGDVSMCCRNSLYCAGNVNDEGQFITVWNSSLMQKAREIFYSGYVPEACLKCGMIECGQLKYLSAEITEDFYKDSQLKEHEKQVFANLIGK